jgi:uncharacterized protein (DUF1015 family)
MKGEKMAIVKPFKALRPVPEKADSIASPPYDVVDTEEALEMAKDNPNSFLHVVRSEIDLPPGTDPYSPIVYQKAAKNLNRLINDGALFRDETPAFYIYSQRMGGHFQTGIVACCAVDDFDSNVIRKHELTRKEKEDDRLRHILTTSAQTGPVFLMYKDVTNLDILMEESCNREPILYSFTAPDGVEHMARRISDPKCIKNITKEFASVPNLYIADGHHRSAASSRACAERRKNNPSHTGREEYNYFMAVLFPAGTLKILPYNRIVKDLSGLTKNDFIARIKQQFKVSETANPVPAMKGQFGMYLDGKWYLLFEKPWGHKSDDPVAKLDCQILQDYLLSPILGIQDPRKDNRIGFVGGVHGHQKLKNMVDNGEAMVAFLLHPVTAEDIMSISDSGKTMPPKSTWFEPKLKSGLFIHQI